MTPLPCNGFNAQSSVSVSVMHVRSESLRTSHTWTDGIDGKASISFVHPRPPQRPSCNAARRRPRVKSGGSDKTPPAASSEQFYDCWQ